MIDTGDTCEECFYMLTQFAVEELFTNNKLIIRMRRELSTFFGL